MCKKLIEKIKLLENKDCIIEKMNTKEVEKYITIALIKVYLNIEVKALQSKNQKQDYCTCNYEKRKVETLIVAGSNKYYRERSCTKKMIAQH